MGCHLAAQQTHVVTNLNDSGAGSLRQTISNSAHGDIVTFSPSLLANGSATITLNSVISFNRSLTIKGIFTGTDSLFISGGDSTSIFSIDGSSYALPISVYLEDLVLENARKTSADYNQLNTNGGAIFATELERLSLKNVVMRNNKALNQANGGAVFVQEIDTVSFIKCVFYENSNDTLHNYIGLGGAIRARYCNLIIDSCSFQRNKSNYLGGALSAIFGSLYIHSSLFEHNLVGRLNQPSNFRSKGGAVSAYAMDTVFIFNSSFISNSTLAIGGEGGALYIDGSQTFIDQSIFKQNRALRGKGGAIRIETYFEDTSDTFVMLNCLLDSNQAERGGALDFLNKNVSVRQSLFKNNTAIEGGGIYGYLGTVVLETSSLVNNVASSKGSACYFSVAKTGITCLINKSSILDSLNDASIFFAPRTASWQVQGNGVFTSSIIVSGGSNAINDNSVVVSGGYNIFSGNPSFSITSDKKNIDRDSLQLKPLANYGGFTDCQPPALGSPALNFGDPLDFSSAQNGAVFGRRDCGAAEASVARFDTAILCGTYQWRGQTYSNPGFYADTVYNLNSIDSVGFLILEKQDSLVNIKNGSLIAPIRLNNTLFQWIRCDSSKVEVNGATDSTFKPKVNGMYAVIMINPDCTDTSNCVTYQQVGINELTRQSIFITFYPNPSSGKIKIKVAEHTKAIELRVLDLQGRLVAQQKVNQDEINLESLSAGIFILEWRSARGDVQRDRIVIE